MCRYVRIAYARYPGAYGDTLILKKKKTISAKKTGRSVNRVNRVDAAVRVDELFDPTLSENEREKSNRFRLLVRRTKRLKSSIARLVFFVYRRQCLIALKTRFRIESDFFPIESGTRSTTRPWRSTISSAGTLEVNDFLPVSKYRGDGPVRLDSYTFNP